MVSTLLSSCNLWLEAGTAIWSCTMCVALHNFCFKRASMSWQFYTQLQSYCCLWGRVTCKKSPWVGAEHGLCAPMAMTYHITWQFAEYSSTGLSHIPAISDDCPIAPPCELSDLQAPGAARHPSPSCAPLNRKHRCHTMSSHVTGISHANVALQFESFTIWEVYLTQQLLVTSIHMMHGMLEAKTVFWL